MSSRSDKVRAGIFVLVSLAVLLLILVVVAGLRLSKDTRIYYICFEESVTGLEASSTVRYNGVPVGRVSHIGFLPDHFPTVRVTVEVDFEFSVVKGTKAVLKPQGITGINYIDLEYMPEPGGVVTDLLPERSEIESRRSGMVQLFDTIGNLGEVVVEVKEFFDRNQDDLSATIAEIRKGAAAARVSLENLETNLGTLTTRVGGQLEETIGAAREALEAIRDFIRSSDLQSVPAKVTKVLERAEQVLAEAEKAVASADVQGTLEALQVAISGLESSMREIGGGVGETLTQLRIGVSENRGNLMRILSDFAAFSRNLKLLSQELRNDPSRVFFGRPAGGRREGR